MMSLEYIQQIADEVAEVAELEDIEPIYLSASELEEFRADFIEGIHPTFKFPHIGSLELEHYTLEDSLFCDASGFGSEFEPALTVGQLLAELEPGYYYAITEVGQFQLYLGKYSYRSVPKNFIDRSRVAARNSGRGS